MIIKKYVFIIILCITMNIQYFYTSGNLTQASNEINWNLEVGDRFIWRVTQSNMAYNFLPKDSTYKLEIKSINIWDTGGGKQASQINATLQKYNSSDNSTELILDNKMFIFFNASSNETLFFDSVFDIGIFIPINFQEDFVEGLKEYYINLDIFDLGFPIFYDNQIKIIHFFNMTNQLDVDWGINEEYISNTLVIEKDDEIIYELTLEHPEENKGNFILMIIIITIGCIAGITIVIFAIKKHKKHKNT